MTHLEILPDRSWAGHCTAGSSNKVWAACLAVEREENSSTPPLTLSDTTQVMFLCVHGPSGATLRREEPKRHSLAAARVFLQAKRIEKERKGYASVDFASFLPAFGSPLGLPLQFAPGSPSSTPSPSPLTRQTAPIDDAPAFRHTAARVKAITYEEMLSRLAGTLQTPSPYTVAEKANGERCQVEFDGSILRAYNRKGRPISAPPEGARALCRLGHPFVIDGERMVRELAGSFVAFDVLEWKGETVLTVPYRTRMTRLVRAMVRVGLLHTDHLTPTLRRAEANSTVPGLCVLLGVQGAEQAQIVIEEIRTAGGEGVILRDLNASYAEAGWKYKFLADVDAFVIGIHEGTAEGSLTLAMVRPTDGAAIEVGHVYSGLNGQAIQTVRHLLAQGKFPVFQIRFLPASTIGLRLVMPQTSMEWLRDDKSPQECTTAQLLEQLGQERAPLIAAARPAMWNNQPLFFPSGGV